MKTMRLTMAQALIGFLKNQFVERDGIQNPFFGGCFGIFGHGNVAGVGEALQENPDFRYYQCRNEQAMVHTASAYAKMSNRLRTIACTTSIGPGATNMLSGAALATVNRLPVLLLPGDIFAKRKVAPVLQQLESEHTQDISVNDCFRPVSRYWDRIYRPEQLITALPEAMRVLTSPADTGAVTLALPQDTQTEAFDYPRELFEKRIWVIPRNRPDASLVNKALEWIRAAKRPLIIAGGGVHYSEANEILAQIAQATGIPVGETQAGKGSLHYQHPQSVGAIGVTGTSAANILAESADLVIGVGTRYSDFTTASKTAFQAPEVRFININAAEFDAFKHNGIPLVGDARAILAELHQNLAGWNVGSGYADKIEKLRTDWDNEVERLYNLGHQPLLSQSEVVGAVNTFSAPTDVMVCAAGSLPGDLHKLWRTRDPRGYHLEYGYSCMGYEIAGGLGVKMAAPEKEVYVLLGDGSYLMMSTEIVTSIQEGCKLIIVLLDNHGYASIGGLSAACGSQGFGTRYKYRDSRGSISGKDLPIDYAANASSLGAISLRAKNLDELKAALATARDQDRTTVIVVETDIDERVPGYNSWWDVAVAEVSSIKSVQDARKKYEESVQKERYFL